MRMVVLVVVLAMPAVARADGDLENFLIGPVFGIVVGGKGGAAIGVEGGAGLGPERINVGFDHRVGKDFFYAEIDPWLYLGGTLGVGIEGDGKTLHPVLGAWEGYPLIMPSGCSDWGTAVTIAGGYRYTGVHELYLTIKAGQMHGNVCF